MVATDALPVRPYVTRLTRESLDERDGHRAMKIVAFSINLEQTGDIIIDKNLMELAQKKIKRKLAFSKQGAAELEAFHQEVMSSLKLAFSVFMSGDVRIARQLIAEKGTWRASELAAAESHLGTTARTSSREHRIEFVAFSFGHLS
jgi:phosphate:Na+ symporter